MPSAECSLFCGGYGPAQSIRRRRLWLWWPTGGGRRTRPGGQHRRLPCRAVCPHPVAQLAGACPGRRCRAAVGPTGGRHPDRQRVGASPADPQSGGGADPDGGAAADRGGSAGPRAQADPSQRRSAATPVGHQTTPVADQARSPAGVRLTRADRPDDRGPADPLGSSPTTSAPARRVTATGLADSRCALPHRRPNSQSVNRPRTATAQLEPGR